MSKWEYTCVSEPEQGESDDFGNLLELLNKLGSDGWEAFSVVQRLTGATGQGGFGALAGCGLTVFLKRQSSSPLPTDRVIVSRGVGEESQLN